MYYILDVETCIPMSSIGSVFVDRGMKALKSLLSIVDTEKAHCS